jgi:hypothetical protein
VGRWLGGKEVKLSFSQHVLVFTVEMVLNTSTTSAVEMNAD